MTVGIYIGLVLIIQTMAIADIDLSPTVQEWVDITLARSGESWDEGAGMIGNSKRHGTRGTMFYALGLLQRGREEDRERALKPFDRCANSNMSPPVQITTVHSAAMIRNTSPWGKALSGKTTIPTGVSLSDSA